MKVVRCLLLICGAPAILACSDNAHETTRLSSLQPILFDGSAKKSMEVKSTTSELIEASCDKTVSDILVSGGESGPFASIGGFSDVSLSDVLESCRKNGRMKLDILKSKITTFSSNKKEQKIVYFKALSGADESSVSQLDLTYNPPFTASTPVGFGVNLGAGKINSDGGSFSLQYKIGKPVPSLMKGSNLQIEPLTQ